MNTIATDSLLSQFPESYWRTHSLPHFSPLTADSQTEVGIIGGGIAGILTAYLLAKSGKQVTLIEAHELLSGVTGHTTAKITAQHSLLYKELLRTFGKEKARLYYEANTEGIELIRQTAEELAIKCDLETKAATIYATTEKGAKQISKEARAYETLGIRGILTEGEIAGPLRELPFKIKAALTMPDQAQFHPVKFLAPLVTALQRLGGKVYEQTRAVRLSPEGNTVQMENGVILHCDKVVVATHYPFNDFNGLYFSKLAINRSYAIAAKVESPLLAGMYISVESPTRSLRSIRGENGEDFLLIGGDGHQTGKSKTDTQAHYRNLEQYGKKWFQLREIPYHWSAQDMTTLDKVPYIGQMAPNSFDILVATGFNKWGMSTGAMAAKLLTDLILGRPNRYADLLSPTRGKFKAKDLKRFMVKNTSVGKDLIVTKAQRPTLTPEDLRTDQGGLITIGGEKAGGYRDSQGQLHIVSPTCTHMGCGLRWNDAERSWDCACHGSRFSHSGEVLDGPAVKPLKKLR